MALDESLLLDVENGSSGQAFMKAINAIVKNANTIEKEHNDRFESIETDGFHIGDIRNTYREDLGNKYLLCNGEYVCSYDGYEKIVELLQKSGNRDTLITTYSKDTEYLIDGDVIYTFHFINSSDSVVMRKFNSYRDFIKNSYIEYKIYNTTAGYCNIRVKLFKDKICLLLCEDTPNSDSKKISIASTDFANLAAGDCDADKWIVTQMGGMIMGSVDYGRYAMDCIGDDLIVVLQVGTSWLQMKYYVTSDGVTFNSYSGSTINCDKEYYDHVEVYVKASSENLLYTCVHYGSKYYIASYNHETNMDTWGDSSYTAPTMVNEVISNDNRAKQQENEDMMLSPDTTYIKLTPKTFTISTLPTISSDYGYYYIKAKE